jgi:hypothetical protein
MDFSALTDAELGQMTDRAFREAARCYSEARKPEYTPARKMLMDSADSASDYWQTLRQEQARREAEGNV